MLKITKQEISEATAGETTKAEFIPYGHAYLRSGTVFIRLKGGDVWPQEEWPNKGDVIATLNLNTMRIGEHSKDVDVEPVYIVELYDDK